MIEFTVSTDFIAALLSCIFLPFIHIIIKWFTVHFYRNFESLVLITSYFLSIAIWLILNLIIKEKFDIYANNIISDEKNICDGIFVLGFFFIGYFEFQSLILRGYSLRILSDLFSNNKPLTSKQIAENYSEGKGLKWFLDKRLKGLKYLGLIVENNEKIKLTILKGKIVAIILAFSLKLLRIERCG